MFTRVLSGVLVVPIIVLGVLYSGQIGKTNTANDKVDSLTKDLAASNDRVTSLTSDLAAANNKVTSLTANLTAANDKAASLTTDLATANSKVTSLTSDLVAANSRVTALTADLAAANTNVTRLTVELATANSRSANLTVELAASNNKVTSLTADLALAMKNVSDITAELEKAKEDVDTLAVALLLIGYPRHFYTLQELTDWLAKDDTNTNPAFANLRNAEKAYILMIRALHDGFILPGYADYNNGQVYYNNRAIVGGDIYYLNVATDQIVFDGTTTPFSPRPLQPLP